MRRYHLNPKAKSAPKYYCICGKHFQSSLERDDHQIECETYTTLQEGSVVCSKCGVTVERAYLFEHVQSEEHYFHRSDEGSKDQRPDELQPETTDHYIVSADIALADTFFHELEKEETVESQPASQKRAQKKRDGTPFTKKMMIHTS